MSTRTAADNRCRAWFWRSYILAELAGITWLTVWLWTR